MLLAGAVLGASVVAAHGAARTGLPVLVAFLGLGMLLGSDGPGGIAFDDAELARRVGTVGLGLILYEGGLQTSFRRLRQVAWPAALLSTVGVVVSALVTGAAARWLFDLSWLEAILVGAVVASTDAAAVFATLRFTHVRRRLARTLEAESGGNDPMAIALTLGLIAWIEHPRTYGLDDLVLLVVRQIGLGAAVGVSLGFAATQVFARIPPSIGAFAPVASVAAAALAFGAADAIGGSGFLSVYLVGLAVGSTPSRYRGQLVAFHEGVAFVAGDALRRPRPARVPARPPRGRGTRACARVPADAGGAPRRGLGVDGLQPVHEQGTRPPRLGGPARRRPDRTRDVRADVGGPGREDDLQRRLLR